MQLTDSWLAFVIMPAIGALIGAVTNELAIKMLFRPYRQWRFLGLPVPLTPGLIPRQRHQIAESIAETFVAHVFSQEDLKALILEKSRIARLKERVGGLLDKLGVMLNLNEGMLGMARSMAGDYVVREVESLAGEAGESADAVREQVRQRIDAMDLESLERLVLGFSRKQFRHITWFGALLGGLIGLVQAGLVYGLG
ncbi:MAG: DUF445 family protein [Gammaproteobacteria bacterium]|nr:DUF445 family protein [Gammaproteobacteria bacterium]